MNSACPMMSRLAPISSKTLRPHGPMWFTPLACYCHCVLIAWVLLGYMFRTPKFGSLKCWVKWGVVMPRCNVVWICCVASHSFPRLRLGCSPGEFGPTCEAYWLILIRNPLVLLFWLTAFHPQEWEQYALVRSAWWHVRQLALCFLHYDQGPF